MNSFLSRPTENTAEFGAPAGAVWRAAIGVPAIMLGLALAAVSLGYSGSRFSAHSYAHVTYLPVQKWIIVLATLLPTIPLTYIAARKLRLNRIVFDLEAGTYRQASVEQYGWDETRKNASTVRLGVPVVIKGRSADDLEGIRLEMTVPSTRGNRNQQYVLQAVWRNPAHPGAQLSQVFANKSDAEAELRNAADLLGVAALDVSKR